MNVIVMGCGRIGTQIAITLWREGHQVTVLDPVPESFLSLPMELRETEGSTIVCDGILEEELIHAGIKEADVFVAVSNRDNRNAMAAQRAKHIFNVPHVVCRVGDVERQEMYNKLGLAAISPTKITSALILEAVFP
ncbi:MAG: NAD-binding protein [Chloroflexota bacterium]|nr:NAD-binding protein [Chloroflexota bacterium]